ncbi:MAG TPA: Re/Si-specific NAD(P)(+) transhydrogenase subunit alpha [Thauera sp.]|nr:Re/Si-specific NAD(P)(+) transhydrogenase subunit alpha [Thauera sp.]
MLIGVPAETRAGETRVAATAETVKKLAGSGHRVLVQAGAGASAAQTDEMYRTAGAEIVDRAAALGAEIVLKVRTPQADEIAAMRPGAVLVGMLEPFNDEGIAAMAAAGLTAFALEAAPRTTRAQSMDVLSSQANIAGYKAVLIAASVYGRMMPMMMTAAGTVKAARVLILGAGVAGLQAIATAKRLGAVIEASDVRPAVKEQIESLGAKFVDTGVSAAGSGGYARELTDEEKAKQAERLAKAVAQCDALITTAAIPGRPAPKIITADMVARMKPGAVVVDMAAETGGNVEGTVAGEKVWINDVLVIGPTNIASRMPVHASEMIAKNLFNFISPFIKDGALALDWEDEVMSGSCLTHAGEVRHAGVRQVLGL